MVLLTWLLLLPDDTFLLSLAISSRWQPAELSRYFFLSLWPTFCVSVNQKNMLLGITILKNRHSSTTYCGTKKNSKKIMKYWGFLVWHAHIARQIYCKTFVICPSVFLFCFYCYCKLLLCCLKYLYNLHVSKKVLYVYVFVVIKKSVVNLRRTLDIYRIFFLLLFHWHLNSQKD